VSAFGDSVLLGAGPALTQTVPDVAVDAVEGRQARAVFDDVSQRLAAGTLGADVVIHAGNNGVISAADLSHLLNQLAGRRRVVVVNDRVPRDWQGPNNSVLAQVVPSAHNAVLVNWFAASANHPAWFYSDGLHLRPAGASAYAALIAAALSS
jgi:lysophospholipase L1-like esterase